jgi:PAS domain S-box-containing protein
MTDLPVDSPFAAALARDTQIAVIMADAGGVIRFWNAGAEAFFGHTVREAVGQRVDLVVPHEYRDMHWAAFNRTIGAHWPGSEAWGEIDGLHSSGAQVPLEVLLTPLRDAEGRVEAVFGMFRRRG